MHEGRRILFAKGSKRLEEETYQMQLDRKRATLVEIFLPPTPSHRSTPNYGTKFPAFANETERYEWTDTAKNNRAHNFSRPSNKKIQKINI